MKRLGEKTIITNFLKQHTLATIATVNPKNLKPESALIAFAELENLEILFITLEGSRKYTNLLQNTQVAMVIGWDKHYWRTLQYEGLAVSVEPAAVAYYKELFSQKKDTPCTEVFLSNPDMKLFKITPTWIGYSDFTGKKPQVIELKNF
ncbi:MAG: pyridoxamine 5'-phosphate oxidase family protein [Patescibacteria group bacterium]